MVPSIVTCWPPETGDTATILLTTVPVVPATSVVEYVHVSPTPTGNGRELDDTADVDPPELELVEWAAGLPDWVDVDDPEPVDPDPPHPARTRPITAAIAPAESRNARALVFIIFSCLVVGVNSFEAT
jgi:hypothetical protein